MSGYRGRGVPVELQLSFGAPITSAEGIKEKEERGKISLQRKEKALVPHTEVMAGS